MFVTWEKSPEKPLSATRKCFFSHFLKTLSVPDFDIWGGEFPPIHLKVCIQPTLFPSLMDPKVEVSAACHVDMWIWKRVDMLGSVCGAAGNCRIINCCPVAPDQTMMTRARWDPPQINKSDRPIWIVTGNLILRPVSIKFFFIWGLFQM